MAARLRSLALANGSDSPISLLRDFPEINAAFLGAMKDSETPPAQVARFLDSWPILARHNQIPPAGPWRIWFLCTGRGFGKNRTASEWVHDKAAANPSLAGFLGARTLGGAGKTIVGHPRSGLLVTQREANPCEYKAHLRKVVWENGAYADIHSSEEPDDARGPEYAWGFGDEVATWKRNVDFMGNTTWTNLQFGLRGGSHPQMIAATTPRPVDLVRELLEKGSQLGSDVELSIGTMTDNAANLPDSFLEYIDDKYRGTRLYRQEVSGEMLLDLEDAILTTEMLDASRVAEAPEMARVLVAVDPALSHHKKSDKTGINVTGLGVDGDLYSLADRSCKMSPDGWSKRVADTCMEFGTTTVVAETNVIGEAVETLIRAHDTNLRVHKRHANRKKHDRAERILQKHEQGKAHIVGTQQALEDQLVQFTPTGWDGDGSPDEADAYVWGGRELLGANQTSWADMGAGNG